MKGLLEYSAGSKTTWRGWQWNRIVERLAVEPKDATVIYLCGPDDLDARWAMKRGFLRENLIAVDLSEENIRRVRSGGGLGVCADLSDILLAWPADWPIDVIIADFCGGLAGSAVEFLLSLICSPVSSRPQYGITLSVNMQRGRDADSNDYRSMIAGSWDIFRDQLSGLLGMDFTGIHPKHRGWAFFNLAVSRGVFHAWPEDMSPSMQAKFVDASQWCMGFMDPAFESYSSTGRTYFDSVVLKWPGVSGGLSGGELEDAHWRQGGTVDRMEPKRGKRLRSVRRKLAALRAMRTKMIGAVAA